MRRVHARGRSRALVLFVALQLAECGLVHADDDARAWLERMARADHSLSYDGIFVYVQGAKADVMRVIRSVEGGSERERLVALTGPVREVIRENNTVTCILPDEAAVEVGTKRARSPFPKLFADRFALIEKSYDFHLEGTDRVAGRGARHVMIRPKDSFRYGYDLWLDDDSALLLKSQTVDAAGQQVEQILFTTIDIVPHVPPALLEPQTHGRHLTWRMPDAGNSIPDDERWRVTWLPAGFSQTVHERRQVVPNGPAADHVVYTDGLASVSLFVEEADKAGGAAPAGRTHVQAMGAVHVYRRPLKDLLITVVGEVPAATVQRIGDSIRVKGV